MRKESISNFDELLSNISYLNSDEIELVTKVYNYASSAHFGQKRRSGEDYIIHPLNVAYILSNIHGDVSIICAALLHDTIEDCDVTKEELEEKFNKEIANLVDGITKINKLDLSGSAEAEIATQRKI